MKSSIKVIKFTAIVSMIFVFLTYVITVNMEVNFVNINSEWFSNNFALTVCGGIFTSTVVVHICEVQKYLDNKCTMENYIFSHMYYMYRHLIFIRAIIEKVMENDSIILSGELLKQQICNISAETKAIYFAEYYPFLKSNKFFMNKEKYNTDVFNEVEKFLHSCNYFEMAILRDELDNLKDNYSKGSINSKSKNTAQILKILRKNVNTIISTIDEMMGSFDKYSGKRFSWDTMRNIDEKNIRKNRTGSLEEFLHEEKVKK